MHADVPLAWTGRTVTIPVKSSNGRDVYPVVVSGDTVTCGCRGSRYQGRCRHAAGVRAWLFAVIPPPSLPE